MTDTEMLTVYTTTRCGDCVAAKRALDALGVPFREVDLSEDPRATEYVMAVNDGRRSVPTLAFGDHAASLSGFSRRRLDAFLVEAGLREPFAAPAEGDA